MKKTEIIAAQADLIESTLRGFDAILTTTAEGSQEAVLALTAGLGMKTAYIAEAITEDNSLEEVKARFDMSIAEIGATPLEELQEANSATKASKGKTPPSGISKDELDGMLADIEGMINRLTTARKSRS